jgi:hypothetical protein
MNMCEAASKDGSTRSLWLVRLGVPWAVLSLSVATIAEPTPENLTLFTAILFSGVYTLLLRVARPLWLPRFTRNPLRYAVWLGIFNAAAIEALFLLLERLFKAEGIAAHPNLIVDLLLTMPWYAPMVITFVRVQNRRRFSAPTVLLLGAVYELGADGIVAQLIGFPFGDSQLLDPVYWIMLLALIFWQFILVYSSMVLPPAWLVAFAERPEVQVEAAWRDALRPTLWLIPFALYLLLFITLWGSIGA